MAVGRRSGSRQEPAVNYPKCTRAFVIGSDFVMDVVATGRIEPSGRAEVRCGICGHTWWSKDPVALRRVRAVARSQRIAR